MVFLIHTELRCTVNHTSDFSLSFVVIKQLLNVAKLLVLRSYCLLGSNNAAVHSVYCATLVDAALFSWPKIASQIYRHIQQCQFVNRAGATRSPLSTDSLVEYSFVHSHWRAYPKSPLYHSTPIPNPQQVNSEHSSSTTPSVSTPTKFLIILRRIFSFRYLGTFRRSVNERRHIIQFKLRVYSPNLFNIYFSCCICRLGTDTFPFGQVIKWIQPSGSNECLNTWGNKLCSSSEDRKEFIVLILWRCWRI